jgi:hypothetical protein
MYFSHVFLNNTLCKRFVDRSYYGLRIPYFKKKLNRKGKKNLHVKYVDHGFACDCVREMLQNIVL